MASSKSDISSDVPLERSSVPTSTSADVSISETASRSERLSLGGGIDYVLRLLSSVRFGLIMLGTLLTCCMIGMLIMQVNVEGFQNYYNVLSPAKKAVFGRLGFFEIYTSWYFSLLLAVTGLNIILASIDRFPTAWQYISKPKLDASPKFIRAQMYSHESTYLGHDRELVNEIKAQWQKARFRVRVTEREGRVTVFAQRNVWNRLGAYAVHVALLTIFTGGFLTARYGAGGSMWIEPGGSSDRFTVTHYALEGPQSSTLTLPFRIECLDLQQKLVRLEGGLDQQNTIDWLSFIRVVDNSHTEDFLVHLNNVGDYRGYRFFQTSTLTACSARKIVVDFEPVAGGEAQSVTIPRNGSVEVPGLGAVRFVAFYPDFEITPSGFSPLDSSEYSKPFAQLEILTPGGGRRPALALSTQASAYFDLGSNGGAKDEVEKELLIDGKRVLLRDFEKVSRGHALTIQYDPGRTPVYIGFLMLFVALCSVFFFSHQRIWAVIEPAGNSPTGKVYIGGNVNRNRQGFEATFNKLILLTNANPPDGRAV